jgi:hypothetical protein
MSSIYAQQLPPVAVAITTENDEEEGKREIALHQVFSRIPEVCSHSTLAGYLRFVLIPL